MMTATRSLLRGVALRSMLLATVLAAPAHAADTADTALLAAFGLTAASGETKLGTGAGDIEAWLLTAAALDDVAEDIASELSPGNYILLTRDEKVNLAAPVVLAARIVFLQRKIDGLKCAPSTALAAGVVVKPSDIGGMLKTDTTFAGIVVAAEDRALVNAVAAKGTTTVFFHTAADAIAPQDSALVARWNELTSSVEVCRGDPAHVESTAVKLFEALDKEVSVRSEGVSLLERASALAALADKKPKLVRLAIERAGGTTIVRSNIWYKLGFPGAAVMGGGLVASFRVVDPVDGRVDHAGIVRCGFPQRRFEHITRQPVIGTGCMPKNNAVTASARSK